ncbi:MAG: AIM24 family protein [Cyanobacteria bacterium P01_H01_bin.15]
MGKVFFGYDGITQLYVAQALIVDNSHLVAYEPTLSLNLSMPTGLVGWLTAGEGFVNRMRDPGKV